MEKKTFDLNAYLDALLAPLGLPRCEDPMRGQTSASYITWQQREKKTLYASGAAYAEFLNFDVYLWCAMRDDWQALRDAAAALLVGGEGMRVAGVGGDKYLPDIDRRCVPISCRVDLGGAACV